jgi:hypothetical protein
MYCLRCGQHQVSEDVRFCCACGAKLEIGERLSTKRLIAMVMHIVLTALAFTGWGPWSMPNYQQIRVFIILISVTTFLLLFSGDLERVFSKLFRQEKDQSNQDTSPSLSGSRTVNQVGPALRHPALPPVRSVPVNSPGQRSKNTAEMAPPPSITEHTTELLDTD